MTSPFNDPIDEKRSWKLDEMLPSVPKATNIEEDRCKQCFFVEISVLKNNRSWAAAFGVFVCGLVLLEIIIRVFVWRSNLIMITEPDMPSQFAAGSSIFRGTEGYGNTFYVATDEIATPFTTGTSIVVFGDSFTEGYQVNDNEKYVSIAEKILHERGVDVDLHNFGKSSKSLADHIWFFKHISQQYRPKIVVLQLNQKDFMLGYQQKDAVNYFKKQSDESIQVIHKPTSMEPQYDLLRFLQRNFSILGEGYNRFYRYRRNIMNKYLAPQDQEMAMADISNLEDEETILAKISLLQQEIGDAKLVLILAPPFPIIGKNDMIPDNFQYYKLVVYLSKIPDLVVIDPSVAFVNLFKTNRCPSGFDNTSPCTGHWNEEGHEIVGRLLADELQKIMK